MKYLIVGLGNMHPDYDQTRHNIGFDVVDELVKKHNKSFKNERLADLCELKHRGKTLIVIKPSTYMNLSGKSVRYWMQKKKIPLQNILVIVDDFNLEFGKLRLRGQGSAGGHNGLKDIQSILETQQYSRLRIGIGNQFSKGRQSDYVLGKWTEKECLELSGIMETGVDIILSFCFSGLQRTMSSYNSG